MSERVVESSVDEVPEMPEILEKVLLFSLDRAKTKMEAGEDIIPFTSLAVKETLFMESHPAEDEQGCFNLARHTVEHARGAQAYSFCYDGYVETDDGTHDALIAEGGESGGHVGDASTMALVPQVVDAVKIPVIAAGGIGDGRGMAAALMLGAQGVQVGTRFLVANECTVSEEYKERVLKAKDISTIVTGRRTGHAVRCLKTPFTTTFAKKENEGAPVEELEQMGAGALRKAAKDGNYEEGSFMCGQIAGLVNKEQPAAEIIREMFAQAEELLKGAAQWVR